MNGNQQELSSSNQIDPTFNYMKYVQKPIEMYVLLIHYVLNAGHWSLI